MVAGAVGGRHKWWDELGAVGKDKMLGDLLSFLK